MVDGSPAERRREVRYHPGDSGVTPEEEARGPAMTRGLVAGSVLALLVGWIPLVGPAIAGFVGGWYTRSRIRGIYATQIPAFICITWGWIWTYLPEIPFLPRALVNRIVPLDAMLGGTSTIIAATVVIGQYIVCLLFGWIGGWAEERREGRATEQWPRPV